METDSWVGKTIGKYRLEKFVGCGGMGTLYMARHTTLDKIVALKILHPNLVLGEQGEKIAARFIREARTAAQLKHPNIVEVYDIEREGEILYIVMEFILGKTIQQILQEQKQIPVVESLYIVKEVAKGLKMAHERGIIHRDIKPANIMITQEGVVKLTDFGLARVVDDVSFSVAGQVFGTPLYSAPEQVEDGSSVDLRADLYSLGVSLFQMLAGDTPYQGNNSFLLMSQHLTAEIPSVRTKVPSIPPAIDQLIHKLMAKKAQDRYQDASTLIREIDRYLGILASVKLDIHNVMECSPFLRIALQQATRETDMPREEETPVDADSEAEPLPAPGNVLATSLTQVLPTERIEREEEKKTIRVLIVDDSSLMRKAIQRALEKYQGLNVVGVAKDGKDALEVIPNLRPDVITLDVNMPVMDGITTLKHIAVQFPCPVVMLSAFTQEGASTTFDCLTLGAIDFICKPSQSEGKIEEQIEALVTKIRAASRVHVKPTRQIRIKKADTTDIKKVISRPNADRIVVIGAGRGADGTYLRIIPYLMKSFPAAILAIQYMEPKIFPMFSQYLNSYSRIVVKELEDKEILKKGVCYLINAPTFFNIKPSPLGAYCHMVRTGSAACAVDKMFSSAAESFKTKSIGVLLTGKEQDGLEGLSAIKKAGGTTLAQSPQTCIEPHNVYRALDEKLVDKLVAEADIPAMLWHLLKETH